ncbi:MAG: radical SAM protein [Oscillospiraceae bacterium]
MKCTLCPRMCGADRAAGEKGFCGMGGSVTAARAALHFWEEPCISGTAGSGTVFFSGCVLRCAYCQNYGISSQNLGKEISTQRLAQIFLELQQQGAHNINLVNPTHFVPQIIEALDIARENGVRLPVVYNSGGYERVETLRTLEGYVQIYLPDVKYFSDELAQKLSCAPNYFDTAMAAVEEMLRQTGAPLLDEKGIMQRGTILRHLVLPDSYRDSVEVIRRVGERFGGRILFSLMSQYTPFGRVKTDPALSRLNRRITTFEYRKALDAVLEAGLEGFMQEKSSAKEEYTPDFDFTGL